jgi:hypothetical protein
MLTPHGNPCVIFTILMKGLLKSSFLTSMVSHLGFFFSSAVLKPDHGCIPHCISITIENPNCMATGLQLTWRYGGNTIVWHYPDPHGMRSVALKQALRSRFLQCVEYYRRLQIEGRK